MKVAFSSLVNVAFLNRLLKTNLTRRRQLHLFSSSISLSLSSSEDETPNPSFNLSNDLFSIESRKSEFLCSTYNHEMMVLIKVILARNGWNRLAYLNNHHRVRVGFHLDEQSVIMAFNILFDETSNAAISLYFFRWLEINLRFNHTVRSNCSLIHILVRGNMNHTVVELVECVVRNYRLQPIELVKIVQQQICSTWVLETVYSMFVQCYSAENMIDEALEMMCLIREFDIFVSTRVCDSVIKSLLDSDREEVAWNLLQDMQDRGLVRTPTVSLFINYYCSKGNAECGWKFMTHMKTYGMKPDVIAFTPIIRFLCKMCYVREATCFMFKMIQMEGILPDTILLTSIINGYCKVGRPGDAVLVMKLFQVVPDVFVYDSFIAHLCKDSDMQQACAVFQEMSDSRILADSHAYTTMINGYCKARDTSKALQYLGRMLKDGIEPSITTYTTLIDCYCKSGDMETAQNLLRQMKREGLTPDIIVYNTLINGYKNEGHLQKAYELLSMMKSAGILPDIVTYNTILHGLIVGGFVSEANDMLDELTRRGFCPDVVTFTSVINAYSKKGCFQEVFLVWSYMTDCNVAPDMITCSALISGYCRARRMDEARALFQKVVSAGLVPDLILYNTLIHGFCRVGNIEEACHMINMMVKNNIIPSDVTYRAIILGYEKKRVHNPVDRAVHTIKEILHINGVYVNQS